MGTCFRLGVVLSGVLLYLRAGVRKTRFSCYNALLVRYINWAGRERSQNRDLRSFDLDLDSESRIRKNETRFRSLEDRYNHDSESASRFRIGIAISISIQNRESGKLKRVFDLWKIGMIAIQNRHRDLDLQYWVRCWALFFSYQVVLAPLPQGPSGGKPKPCVLFYFIFFHPIHYLRLFFSLPPIRICSRNSGPGSHT